MKSPIVGELISLPKETTIIEKLNKPRKNQSISYQENNLQNILQKCSKLSLTAELKYTLNRLDLSESLRIFYIITSLINANYNQLPIFNNIRTNETSFRRFNNSIGNSIKSSF